HLGELASGVLEPVLHLGTGRTRGSGLLERCGSLLGREVGKGHGLTSGRKGLACNLATRTRRGNRGGASPPRSRVRVEIEGLDPLSRRSISISRGGGCTVAPQVGAPRGCRPPVRRGRSRRRPRPPTGGVPRRGVPAP